MTWEEVCELWDGGREATVTAPYGSGRIWVRPTPDGQFEYKVQGHRMSLKVAPNVDWRKRDRQYNASAANGDFTEMRYSIAEQPDAISLVG